MMKVFTIEETCYNDLEETLGKVMKYGKKLLECMEESELESKGYMGWKRRDDEYEDYDWKIKKGRRY